MTDKNEVLRVINLTVSYQTVNKSNPVHKAVNNVSFSINKGETLGLVGESGCGKTTLGRTIVRLQKESSGSIILNGTDLCKVKQSNLRSMRKQMQMIFQNPYSSLNPRMSVSDIISEPLPNSLSKIKKIKYITDLMIQTGLDPAMIRKFPHEFSGGQRQRIAIARAIAANPALIIADEPVSSLDVSVQAQILNVLKSLQNKLNLTTLFISHDISVVKYISRRVAVMYKGNIVEIGSTESIFNNPVHPYTRLLLSSVPVLDPDKKFSDKMQILTGETHESEMNLGCPFSERCTCTFEACKNGTPALKSIPTSEDHFAACFRTELLK